MLPTSSFGYSYDAVGNRLSKTVGASTDVYACEAASNRIAAIQPASGPLKSFVFDANGSTTSDSVNTYAYDARGRLIAESDALGNVQREYLYLGDIPVMVVRQGSAAGGSEVVVDNGSAGFAVTGTWPASTSVAGYLGANYQTHEANGVPPSALVADNLAGSFTGTWPASTSVSGYLGTNYQVHAAGTGASVFTWTLNVPSDGTYEAYARWTQHPNRATNAKYTVNHAAGASVVTVNQEQGGGAWQLLGTYAFNAGATSISLWDDANDYVIADAVMLVPPGAAPNTATWTASIPSAGSYEVYARWTAHPNRATDAKYTVNHAAGATTVTVNQEAGGGTWSLLGTYNFDAGAATVSLTDQANGYVIADAVMFLPPGSAPNTATWTPNVPAAGQYEVFARWTQHANRATNAPYAITHAGGTTQVAVNQQAAGGAWNSLGTYTFSPGPAHKVTLSDQANGYVIADAIRLVPISIPSGPEYFAMHADHLNTPRLVADATGTTVWRWDQAEPFGNNPADKNPSGLGAFDLPLRLPGQRYDAETGIHYNYFRDYDPSLGRYGESDPVGLLGGLNTYAYVGGAPLSGDDLLGLAKLCCRPLDSFVGRWPISKRHCYVVADDGTRYSLFPRTRAGVRVGVPQINVREDPADPRGVGGECLDCPALECVDQNSCLKTTFSSYPVGRYSEFGPNSNTFARRLAQQCCKGGVPSGVHDAPGISASPPSVTMPTK